MAVPEISVDDLADRLRDGATVLDVRNPDEYAERHIPGVALIPLPELDARTGEVPDAHPVHVICGSGKRSAQGAQILLDAGFDAVSVAGGMGAWVESGGRTESGGPTGSG